MSHFKARIARTCVFVFVVVSIIIILYIILFAAQQRGTTVSTSESPFIVLNLFSNAVAGLTMVVVVVGKCRHAQLC